MHLFNQATLTRQAWRLRQQPESLAAKIFKAGYYLHGDLMEARVGYQASYKWRSVFAARVLIEKGARWQVGDGRTIKIWKHNWLPD